MYINGPREVYLIDRDNCVFLAPHIVFPARKRQGDCVRDTLVDGVCVYSMCALKSHDLSHDLALLCRRWC